MEKNLKITYKKLKDNQKNKLKKAGFFVYEIRHGDDGEPATVEKNVFVNFYGTLLSPKEIRLEDGFAFYDEVIGGVL